MILLKVKLNIFFYFKGTANLLIGKFNLLLRTLTFTFFCCALVSALLIALVLLGLKLVGSWLDFKFLTCLSKTEVVFPSATDSVYLFLSPSMTLVFLLLLITVRTLAIDFLRVLIFERLATAVPETLVNLMLCSSSLCFLSSVSNSSEFLFLSWNW